MVIGILRPRDFDNDLIEDLARQHPAYRIVSLGEAVLVAVGEPESRPVLGNGPAEFSQVLHPMHGKGCLVGPGQGLVRLDEKNALGQPGDDLLQVPMLCSLLRNARVHLVLGSGRKHLGSEPESELLRCAFC